MPAGMALPCPYCSAQITVPQGVGMDPAESAAYMAWAMEHGNTAAALADAQAPAQAPNRANFSSTSNQVLFHTPAGKALVFGSHVDESGRWCFRAQDASSGHVVWETPRNLELSSCPGLDHVAARGSLLLVRVRDRLLALDQDTGRQHWQAVLPSAIRTLAGIPQGDSCDLHLMQGALALRTEDDRVLALNLADGRALWQRESDERLIPLPQGAGILLRYSDGVEMLAASGQTLLNMRGDGCDGGVVAGPYVVLKVENYQGAEDDVGLLIVDGTTGQPLKYFSMPGVDSDSWAEHTAFIGGAVVYKASANSGATELYIFDPQALQPPDTKPGFFASFFGRGRKSWARPCPGSLNLGKIMATGDALVGLGHPAAGGEHRVVVLDPQTLQLRYDSGPLPYGEFTPHIAVGAETIAYRVPVNDDGNRYELRVVQTATGQVIWTRDVGHWAGHYYARTNQGERVVVYHDTNIVMLRPSDGAVLGGYPTTN